MEVIKRVKLNLSITPEVKEYLIEQSNIMGMSSSAFITMLISQHKQQAQALSSVDLMNAMMAQMKQMEGKSNE